MPRLADCRGASGVVYGLAVRIHTLHGKHVLGEVNADEDNAHDFPFRVS